MNVRSKTGIEILQVAIGVGILGDILLRQMPWGLNVLLFNLAFVTGAVMLLWRRKPEYLTPQTWALFGAQIFFASMFVWRDSDELHFADSVAIVAIMSALIVPKLGLAPRVADALHYIAGFVWAALNSMFGCIALLVGDIEWKTADRSSWSKAAIGVVRGLLIVTPLILIFGALFVAADAAYEGLVNRVFNFDISIALSHAAIFSVFAWATAGYLRSMTLGKVPMAGDTGDSTAGLETGATRTGGNTSGSEGRDHTGGNATVSERASEQTSSRVAAMESEPVETRSLPNNATILEHINRSDPPNAEPADKKARWSWATIDNGFLPSAFTLGAVEIGIIFGLIDLLFVSFVVIQIPYLFGGMELVQNTPDFKLAEYARRGFGELVAVAALVLPLLLVSHWLIQKESRRAATLFKALASVQIVLLFVIMASAVQRLVLLTGDLGYGLTTVRLYPMIFMIWLSVVFVWFALTVLRGSRKFFAWGALWSAFFILGATHLLDPDDFIVRTNLGLMQQGRDFDARYNSNLSADSVPALAAALPLMSDSQQCQAKWQFHRKLVDRESQADLRSWNLARSRAGEILQQNEGSLADYATCAETISKTAPE